MSEFNPDDNLTCPLCNKLVSDDREIEIYLIHKKCIDKLRGKI